MSTRLRPLALALVFALVPLAAGNRSETEAPAPTAEATPPPPMPAPSVAPAGVSVVSVQLGRAVGLDKKVTLAADSFAPTDTIYASVETQGTAPSATLTARWTYQDGQTVHEETQTIAPTGPATTEFHIAKPDGWPKGTYRLEILVDGVSAQTASFRVA